MHCEKKEGRGSVLLLVSDTETIKYVLVRVLSRDLLYTKALHNGLK